MLTHRPRPRRLARASLLIGGLLILRLAAGGPAWAQCAMCATAAEAGDVGRGLTISILFMLGTLLTLVSGVVVLVMRANRREAPPGVPPDRPRPGD